MNNREHYKKYRRMIDYERQIIAACMLEPIHIDWVASRLDFRDMLTNMDSWAYAAVMAACPQGTVECDMDEVIQYMECCEAETADDYLLNLTKNYLGHNEIGQPCELRKLEMEDQGRFVERIVAMCFSITQFARKLRTEANRLENS